MGGLERRSLRVGEFVNPPRKAHRVHGVTVLDGLGGIAEDRDAPRVLVVPSERPRLNPGPGLSDDDDKRRRVSSFAGFSEPL